VDFEEFVRAEVPQLYRYARVLTGNADAAHDAVAEALLRAQTKWSHIGQLEHPAAYVRTMITNEFLQERRRWSFRMIAPTRSGVLPDGEAVGADAPIEDRQQVEALLRTLPPRQRAAVAMRFLLDLTDAEIGSELGVSPVSVRSLVSRGLAGLRINGPDDWHSSDGSSRKATT
jgi:RNA polymerase sigma factor (sigma-70 family)